MNQHFLQSDVVKEKIIAEIKKKLRLTEKKKNTILTGRKLNKIKNLIKSQNYQELGISKSEFMSEINDVINLILENNKKLSSYKELLGRAKKNKKYDEIIDLEKLVEKTQDEIKKLDYEINQMVYKIYELTVNEIKIIENN